MQLKKTMSTFSLAMTGITTMVGSGWLLATQKIVNVAGPVGVFAWVIGMFVAMLVALFCIEIGTKHPSAGGIGYYSMITHGKFSGFITQWINWLSIMPVPAIEAQAIVQYLSSSTAWCHSWYDAQSHTLTDIGIFYALLLMLFFMLVNYFGLKLFVRFNNVLTVIKFVVPVLTIGCLVYMGIHPGNFGHNMHEFAPFGLSSIATAVISCGVIMSFNGFQTPLNFSEEIQSPKTQLPIAIIGGILFTFILYVGLQVVFIGAVDPQHLLNGWAQVNFSSPYVNLLIAANLQVMAWVVMATAALAPAACGAAFLASSSRILFNLSRDKLMPEYMSKLDDIYASPRHSIVINVIASSCFLFFFKGWTQLVAVISVLHVFSYLAMPVVVLGYRNISKHDIENTFKLPFAPLFAFAVLYILSVLLFFAAWPNIGHLAILCVPGLGFFLYYSLKNDDNLEHLLQSMKHGSWLILYLICVCVICYLGNNQDTHQNLIDQTTSIIALGVVSLVSLIFGVYLSKDYIDNLKHKQ